MADVTQKAVTANNVTNGKAVAAVDKKGNKQALAPVPELHVPSVTQLESKYTDRFVKN